jgi:hypothetical protein
VGEMPLHVGRREHEHARWRTRVWVRSLGGQRTAGERTTSRPNTQPGLPSKGHLWKLSRSMTQPAARRVDEVFSLQLGSGAVVAETSNTSGAGRGPRAGSKMKWTRCPRQLLARARVAAAAVGAYSRSIFTTSSDRTICVVDRGARCRATRAEHAGVLATARRAREWVLLGERARRWGDPQRAGA